MADNPQDPAKKTEEKPQTADQAPQQAKPQEAPAAAEAKPQETQVAAEAKPEGKKAPAKAERPTNCVKCNKSIKKKWYYRNGKYYCTKRCWKEASKEEAGKKSEAAA